MKQFDDTHRTPEIITIAGIDEAGRGPLAGPVVAAAVIFPEDFDIDGINDSKQLSAQQREGLYDLICGYAQAFAYDIVSHEEIDRINILQASLLAMKNSVEKLTVKPHKLLIDGNKVFQSTIPCEAIVKGDSKSLSIAAASIIAKVVRDRIMMELDEEYPEYNWKQNKGYPTKEHIEAVKKYGASKYHRKTFVAKFTDQYEMF